MAGKRHHHVWQMLQRGFSKSENGDNHVWVYEKDKKARRTVTRKFGRESYFYGPEGSDADDNITNFENSAQEFIQVTRQAPDGKSLESAIVAPIVASLEIRSFFLRNEISRLSERMFNALKGYMESKTQTKMLISSYVRNHPELIEDVLDQGGLEGEFRNFGRQKALEMLPDLISSSAADLSLATENLFGPILSDLPNTIRDSHIKALEASFAEANRISLYRHLDFSVRRNRTREYILPDTCLAFLTTNGCRPMSQKGDSIEMVVMPISSNVAIVGKANKYVDRDDATLLSVLASCAFEAFLADHQSPALEKLARRISSNAKMVNDAEVDKILRFDNFLSI